MLALQQQDYCKRFSNDFVCLAISLCIRKGFAKRGGRDFSPPTPKTRSHVCEFSGHVFAPAADVDDDGRAADAARLAAAAVPAAAAVQRTRVTLNLAAAAAADCCFTFSQSLSTRV